MNYTKEQFETLSQWEENFRTARDGNWARNPGRSALAVINDALNAATGVKHRLNAWCQQCILNTLQKAGKLYFEDKAEMEAAAKAAVPECPVPEPEFDPAPPTPVAKQAKPETASPKPKKTATTAKKTAEKKTSTSKAKAAKTEK